MFPWGAFISLAGGAIAKGFSSAEEKKAKQERDAEYARQQASLEAKKNENPFSRSDVQHTLGQYDRQSQQQIENAKGVGAITGATPEYYSAVQKGVAQGRADLMGDIAAGASARADKYEEQLEESRRAQAADQQEFRNQRLTNAGNLAANALSSLGSLVDATAGGLTKDADYWNGQLKDLEDAYKAGHIDQATYDSNKAKYETSLAGYYNKKYKS